MGAEAGQPSVIPPPPPPPYPPWVYAPAPSLRVPVPVSVPRLAPVLLPSARRRPSWVGWLAAVASLAFAVPMLLGAARMPRSGGLHAVTAISSQQWSAEFVDNQGKPARWDPCTPIHYVVDFLYAPVGALSDVQQALANLAQASGMTFVYDGARSERPMRSRSPYQPDVYGDRWAPVLLSWSPPAETDLLNDPGAEAVTVPIALPGRVGVGGSIVSAEVVMNAARQLPVGFGPGPSEGEVLMHELGHAVGLGHVDSRDEAMFPSVRGIAAYGTGDLAGLRALGQPAGCHPAPSARALPEVGSSVG